MDKLKLHERELQTLSSLVRHLAHTLPKNKDVALSEFLAMLGVHGFVFFLFVLALLNLVIFIVPGLSMVLGTLMMIIAAQMLAGTPSPVFPPFIRRRSISGEILHKGLNGAATIVERVEQYVRPRWRGITHGRILWVHLIASLMLSFMVFIPVPILNLPPAFGMVCLAAGLMQRDGLFVIIAYAIAAWSLWLYATIGTALLQSLLGL